LGAVLLVGALPLASCGGDDSAPKDNGGTGGGSGSGAGATGGGSGSSGTGGDAGASGSGGTGGGDAGCTPPTTPQECSHTPAPKATIIDFSTYQADGK